MQASTSHASATRPAAPPTAAAASTRHAWIDVLRGLFVAHMALDHASLFFNLHRPGEELAAALPAPPADLWQFLTRFSGVPVAPGFFFVAGFMVALTSAARDTLTHRLLVRGVVLLAIDALVMGLPRAAMGFYSFAVLSAMGGSLIVIALVRQLPPVLLLAGALAVLLGLPWVDASGLPLALQAVLFEPVRSGPLRSQYPLLPWCAILVLGYVAGRDALQRPRPASRWAAFALAALALFFVLRVASAHGFGGVATAAPLDLRSSAFWHLAKYPPEPAFVALALAGVLAAMAVLEPRLRAGVPAWLAPIALFGRVAFFFYVLHFYMLGVVAALWGAKLPLAGVYAAWLLLLAAMVGPCAWYARLKATRPNVVTRWF